MSKFTCGWPGKTFVNDKGENVPSICPCGWIFPEKIEAAWHQEHTPHPIQREQVFRKPIRRERLPIQRSFL